MLTDGLKLWFEQQRRRLSAKTTLAKSIRYALTRWEALMQQFVCPLSVFD